MTEQYTELYKIKAYLDELWREEDSEPWDNDGIDICISDNQRIDSVLIALDATAPAIQKAKDISAQLIITHHPLIYDPLSSIRADDPYGGRIIDCIKQDISVMSFHTRLDNAKGGVSDTLAQSVGLQDLDSPYPGITIGYTRTQKTYSEFVQEIKDKLNTDIIYGVKSTDRVKKIAVVGGSGKSFLTRVAETGADTYLTGEVTHSAMIEARQLGLNLVCATHHATEAVILPKIKEVLTSRFPGLRVEVFGFDPKVEYGV